MNKIKKLFHYLLHDSNKLKLALLRRYAWLYKSDEKYLKKLFKLSMGKELNLDNPQTFSEKLQWLKLYNRKPEYTQMVDKYEAKKYVANIIGEEYIIPTLGVWDRFEGIDFDKLPDQFVLKTTHGGGNTGVVICKDKSTFDRNKAKIRLEKSLKSDIYTSLREWPYKNVKKRIIAEQFIEESGHKDLPDYKFFCFDGEPKYCQVIRDRNTKETIDFYDMEWNHMPFVGLNPVARNGLNPVARNGLNPVARNGLNPVARNGLNPVAKPQHLSDMVDICRKLAVGIPFSRIDLYVVNEKEYFGEITFYPASGLGEFTPGEWNVVLGQMIDIQTITPPPHTRYRCLIKDGSVCVEKINRENHELKDYKFFCFNGNPKYCQVIAGRESETTTIDWFDRDWNHQPFHEPKDYPFSEKEHSRPRCLAEMCNLAAKLSQGQPFLRVDFYEINNKVKFGELTFFPTSGMGGFTPEEWDYKLGEWIKLPSVNNNY